MLYASPIPKGTLRVPVGEDSTYQRMIEAVQNRDDEHEKGPEDIYKRLLGEILREAEDTLAQFYRENQVPEAETMVRNFAEDALVLIYRWETEANFQIPYLPEGFPTTSQLMNRIAEKSRSEQERELEQHIRQIIGALLSGLSKPGSDQPRDPKTGQLGAKAEKVGTQKTGAQAVSKRIGNPTLRGEVIQRLLESVRSALTEEALSSLAVAISGLINGGYESEIRELYAILEADKTHKWKLRHLPKLLPQIENREPTEAEIEAVRTFILSADPPVLINAGRWLNTIEPRVSGIIVERLRALLPEAEQWRLQRLIEEKERLESLRPKPVIFDREHKLSLLGIYNPVVANFIIKNGSAYDYILELVPESLEPDEIRLSTENIVPTQEVCDMSVEFARYILDHYEEFGKGRIVFVGPEADLLFEATRTLAPSYGIASEDVVMVDIPSAFEAIYPDDEIFKYLETMGAIPEDGRSVLLIQELGTGRTLEDLRNVIESRRDVKVNKFQLKSGDKSIADGYDTHVVAERVPIVHRVAGWMDKLRVQYRTIDDLVDMHDGVWPIYSYRKDHSLIRWLQRAPIIEAALKDKLRLDISEPEVGQVGAIAGLSKPGFTQTESGKSSPEATGPPLIAQLYLSETTFSNETNFYPAMFDGKRFNAAQHDLEVSVNSFCEEKGLTRLSANVMPVVLVNIPARESERIEALKRYFGNRAVIINFSESDVETYRYFENFFKENKDGKIFDDASPNLGVLRQHLDNV